MSLSVRDSRRGRVGGAADAPIVNATRGTNEVAVAVEGLGNGVSAKLLVGGVIRVSENKREAWEDWRLLTALRETGKADVLDALLKEFADSFAPPHLETSRPYRCDFFKRRDKALGAFVQEGAQAETNAQ